MEYAVNFYTDEIVRIVVNPFKKPSLKSSFAVMKEAEPIQHEVNVHGDFIEISSQKLKVHIKKAPFQFAIYDKNGRLLMKQSDKNTAINKGKEVLCYIDMDENDHFYGFGEKTGFLDKRGEKLTMWNSDVYIPHNPETDALYQSIPYFMTLRNGYAHGVFFDNTYKTIFDMKSDQHSFSFWAEGGQLDFYVFAGPTPKDVLRQYTDLTGRMPLPPKWSLGYQQSRYSYETGDEVRELVNNFIEKEIPLDAVYFDIHYMDGYRVFTFDDERFPQPKQLIQELKAMGIHVVPIVDPGVKEDPEYSIYQEGIYEDHFCKYIDGTVYHGDVWPGNSAFPDFTNKKTRNWWGEKHKFYTNLGIEGIWNDMNEPAVFNETKTMDVKVVHGNDGEPKTHRELHNLYGLFMGEATYSGLKKLNPDLRPFLLTRAGFSGIQRYSAVWTGDNRSFWEHLAMALPMCMNLGISGVAFTGPDVGGFAHDATGELLIRWTQFGAFTPFFRNHSAIGTVRQEPWAFGEKVEQVVKKYIQLRYKWLPYLYTLFHEASSTGVPVMRPLFMEYPDDAYTYNLSDQFLVGENVLVAPILQPATFHRVVYLPEGDWYDYWTDKKYKGNQHILVKADIETVPIFIKSGAIIPLGSVISSTEHVQDELTFHIYALENGECEYTLYEDDGKSFAYKNGDYLLKKITCLFANNHIQISTKDIHNSYTPTWKKMSLIIHGVDKDTTVAFNGGVIGDKFDSVKKMLTLEIK